MANTESKSQKRNWFATRLVILALVLLAIAANGQRLMSRHVLRSLACTLGGDVAAGGINVQPLLGQLSLERVSVENPRDATRNLFQFERAQLFLDRAALWQKQLRFSNGQLSGLLLNTPRNGAKASVAAPLQVTNGEAELAERWRSDVAAAGQRWLDTAFDLSALSNESTTEDSDRLSDQLHQQSIRKFDELQSQMTHVSAAVAEIETLLKVPKSNPLRDAERWGALQQKLTQLHSEKLALQQSIEQYRSALPDLARQIDQSYRDSAKPRLPVVNNAVDPVLLAEILHSEELQNLLRQLTDLIGQFRQSVPQLSVVADGDPASGRQVVFHGLQAKPGMIIEQLDVDGGLLWRGERLEFAGSVSQLSSRPEVHGEPIQLQIRAQGSTHWVISGTIDRRAGALRDSFTARCPSMEWPVDTLGDGRMVEIALAPRRTQLEVQLELSGDELSGTVVLTHSDVSMHVDQMHPRLGGPRLAALLNSRIGNMDHFQTTLSLGGTIDAPQLSYRSDLADQFAIAVAESQQQLLEDLNAKRREQAQAKALARIDALNALFVSRLGPLQQSISEQSEQIRQIAEQLPIKATPIRLR